MNWYLLMYSILTASVVVLVFFVSSTLRQLSRTLSNLDGLIGDLRKEIMPLISEVSRTLDQVNSELSTVDGIVRQVQEVSDKVNATTSVAQEVISSPLIKLASFSAGAKKAISALLKRKEPESGE